MIWLTWRQFRAQAATVYAAVAVFAVVLATTGPRLRDLALAGANVFDQLTKIDQNLYNAGLVVMAVVPAIIGAFWGAPMVARELETGTHRLAWNQSITRTRWLATKLGMATLATIAAVGALTLGVSWWAGPIDGITSETHGGLAARLTPVAFAMRGVAPVGYAVFALVLGVTVGVLLRRTVPAMALTLAIFTLVQITVPQWVRPHLLPLNQQTVTITEETFAGIGITGSGTVTRLMVATDHDDWVLANETIDPSGQVIEALPSWMLDCLPPPRPGGETRQARPLPVCLAKLTNLGYRQRVTYHPASRFWPLQWTETALFLAISALLTWFCFWWTRNRLA